MILKMPNASSWSLYKIFRNSPALEEALSVIARELRRSDRSNLIFRLPRSPKGSLAMTSLVELLITLACYDFS